MDNLLDYFEHNGKKYYCGTEILIKTRVFNKIELKPAYFIYYNIAWDTYVYVIKDDGGRKNFVYGKEFWDKFGGVTGNVNTNFHVPQKKQLKDFQIPKLSIGWVWYIALMCIITIFNGAIIYWTLLSIFFFNWRKDVIEKEGYYVEW